MVKAATIIRGDRRQSRRTALHFAAEKGLAAVAFALLSRPEFEEGRAVATFNGTSWIAIERTVAKGHICLAKGIDVFLDHMMSSALPSGSASSDNGYVWARIGQKLDDVRINTEYTERARPQSPGKHHHLPDFSGALVSTKAWALDTTRALALVSNRAWAWGLDTTRAWAMVSTRAWVAETRALV